MEYKIKAEDAQEILNYLGTKPYIEVYKLISSILKLERIEDDITN